MEILGILFLAIRIVIAFVCSERAKQLNRNARLWGTLGVFFPIITLIIIYNLKYNDKETHEIPKRQKEFTNYYTDKGVVRVENVGDKRVYLNGEIAPDGVYALNKYETIEVENGSKKN